MLWLASCIFRVWLSKGSIGSNNIYITLCSFSNCPIENPFLVTSCSVHSSEISTASFLLGRHHHFWMKQKTIHKKYNLSQNCLYLWASAIHLNSFQVWFVFWCFAQNSDLRCHCEDERPTLNNKKCFLLFGIKNNGIWEVYVIESSLFMCSASDKFKVLHRSGMIFRCWVWIFGAGSHTGSNLKSASRFVILVKASHIPPEQKFFSSMEVDHWEFCLVPPICAFL